MRLVWPILHPFPEEKDERDALKIPKKRKVLANWSAVTAGSV
jgi:hypothetical protein